MDFKKVKVTTTIPPQRADAIRQALGNAGAGRIGEYSYCSFSILGTGRSMPSGDATPYIGTANTLEIINEEQVEVVCDRAIAKQVIAALRAAHPYEEPVVDVTPLLADEDL